MVESRKCKHKRSCVEYLCINARTCLFHDLGLKEFRKLPKRVQALIKSGHKDECAACGTKENLSFDHIIPLSRQGEDSNKNGQILCVRCNQFKGNKIMGIPYMKKLLKAGVTKNDL